MGHILPFRLDSALFNSNEETGPCCWDSCFSLVSSTLSCYLGKRNGLVLLMSRVCSGLLHDLGLLLLGLDELLVGDVGSCEVQDLVGTQEVVLFTSSRSTPSLGSGLAR
jgi:hypothetical protein